MFLNTSMVFDMVICTSPCQINNPDVIFLLFLMLHDKKININNNEERKRITN